MIDPNDIVDDNAAWFPTDSDNKQESEKEEINKISSSIAILDEFFADLDRYIEEARGVDIIDGVNPATDPQILLNAVIMNQGIGARLKQIRREYAIKYNYGLKEDDEA